VESFGEWFAGLWRELADQDRAERREILVLSYVHGPDRGEPALGLLGRSWVRRGAGYWARRAAATAAYLVLAALLGVMVLGFGPYLLYSRQYALAAHVPQAVKVLLLVVWYAPAVPAFTAMYRRLVLYGYRRNRLRDTPAPTRFLLAGPMIVLVVPARRRCGRTSPARVRPGRACGAIRPRSLSRRRSAGPSVAEAGVGAGGEPPSFEALPAAGAA
jgi:hypothetical protein